ncbi:AI-2E family transporter [Romboutsia maritimum]|uniref:AI-2E family transporter n=1 Tax=Romboutsia maritimum TaxID=2020948 RepID=A0A371IQD5_9FIRM|nr:AI-2E family transporter [Romboutsia maritimum]RDY22686.1 AI-2E family transporter [Romboutsia maritimum]
MISKENLKYYVFLAIISILIYKIIDNPMKFFSGISGLASFFSIFLISILFTLLLNPFTKIFEKHLKFSRFLSIITSYIIVFLLLIIGLKLIIPSILETLNNLIKEMPLYLTMLNEFLNKNMSQAKLFETIVPHIQENLNTILNQVVDILTKFSTELVVYIFSITSLLFNVVMAIILSIYMLYDKENISLGFKKLLYASVSKNKAIEIIDFFKMSHDIFYNYIIGKIIDSLIIGIIAFIGFKFILKIENVLFLSFIIFLTNIIPYFGPFIGAVPPILMTLVYSPIKALWVCVFILILQQIDGNFIGPKILGDQIGLSPLWIISSVLIGGSLFGFVGVFLSVPVAAIIKYSLDKYVDKRIHIRDSK